MGAVGTPAVPLPGGPGGVVIADASGNAVQFLSWGGAFTAVDGPAAGLTSEDLPSGTLGADQSLQLVGAGRGYTDFAWGGPHASSPGLLNAGQVIPAALPLVTVEAVAEAVEGGAAGTFRFTRTGDLSQPLTVAYTVATGSLAATADTDYTALSGLVTFEAEQATVDVPVVANADGVSDDLEMVTVVLSADPAHLVGSPASLAITDEAVASAQVQVTATVTWQSSSGSTEVGYVTVTRSGGDQTQPLTVWIEPTATFVDDGDTVTAVFAATVEIPAGQAGVTLPILADPATGGFADVQITGGSSGASGRIRGWRWISSGTTCSAPI